MRRSLFTCGNQFQGTTPPNVLALSLPLLRVTQTQCSSPCLPSQQPPCVATVTNCSAGYYCTATSPSSYANACPAGARCPLGPPVSAPIACPANSYSSGGAGACVSCPIGSVPVTSGAFECISRPILPTWNGSQGDGTGPVVGDAVQIRLLSNAAASASLRLSSIALVNGHDVSTSFGVTNGGYVLVLVPATAVDVDWPWRGVTVSLTMTSLASAAVYTVSAAATPPGALWQSTAVTSSAPTAMALACWMASAPSLVVGASATGGLQPFAYSASTRASADYLTSNVSFVAVDVGGGAAAFGVVVAVVAGDVTGDGATDVVIAGQTAIAILTGNGSSTGFTDATVSLLSGVPSSSSGVTGLAVCDVDGDGLLDVVVGRLGSSSPVLRNHGGGRMADESSRLAAGRVGDWQAVACADVDVDGDVDVLVLGGGGDPSRLLVNNGSGYYTDAASARGFICSVCDALTVGDVNNDGAVDVIVTSSTSATVHTFLNNGSGYFTDSPAALPLLASQSLLYPVAIADVDFDGGVDVLIVGSQSVELLLSAGVSDALDVLVNATLRFRDGTGVLPLGSTGTPSRGSSVLVDVDGDGDPDAPGLALLNPRRHVLSSAGVVVVRLLGRDGVQNQHGAVVTLRRSSDAHVLGSRVVGHDGGNSVNQGAYDVAFGVPDTTASYDVGVMFVGGASNGSGPVMITGVLRPMLHGIVPSTLLNQRLPVPLIVYDVPIIVSVTASWTALPAAASPSVLGIGSTVVATAVTALRERGLLSAPGSTVNGVVVAAGDGKHVAQFQAHVHAA